MPLSFWSSISSVWSYIALIPDIHTTERDLQVSVLSTTSSAAFIAFSSEVFFVPFYISSLLTVSSPKRHPLGTPFSHPLNPKGSCRWSCPILHQQRRESNFRGCIFSPPQSIREWNLFLTRLTGILWFQGLLTG